MAHSAHFGEGHAQEQTGRDLDGPILVSQELLASVSKDVAFPLTDQSPGR